MSVDKDLVCAAKGIQHRARLRQRTARIMQIPRKENRSEGPTSLKIHDSSSESWIDERSREELFFAYYEPH